MKIILMIRKEADGTNFYRITYDYKLERLKALGWMTSAEYREKHPCK